MPNFPLPIIGPTYVNRSLPVSAQSTRNFYIEVNPSGNEILSFQPFPGLKPLLIADGEDRGLGRLKNVLYKVSGNTLYKVDSNFNQTEIGTIEGVDRCSLDTDNNNLVITTGVGKPYSFNGATLTQGTDVDLPNASTVTFINRRMVYDGRGGDVVFADLGSPLDVNSLNVANAEADPDDTIAVIAHNAQVYVFGDESTNPYYNSGVGNPPYQVIQNANINLGLDAIHSIAKNKNFVYFLSNELTPYRIEGLAYRSIGSPAIGQAIRKYSKTSDAYGVTFNFDSMNFYLLSFREANETWLFNEESLAWVNLAHGTNGDQHLISDYQFIYGKHVVSDRRNGNLYELDFDTFTDNGNVIQRRRDTLSINSNTFGVPGRDVFMDRLELIIDPGQSLVTEKANIIMQYSDDNGKSWSAERWQDVGEQGDYTYKLWWFGLGTFRNRMFRFTMTDPINWVIISANADVELGLE